MDNLSIAELEQHVSLLKDRVLQVADEIKALLSEDLPKFVEREMKKTFISNPEFAATVSDDQLRQIKIDIGACGIALANQVSAALQADALWFPESTGDEDARKSIAENTALWAAVAEPASQVVIKLISDNGFPPGETPDYRPPTWFIGRRYLPSLSEKYWRHVRELAEASSQIGSIRSEASKSELTRRWDETD